MLGERWLGTIKKDNRYFYVAVIMFVVAAVAHGLMSDFPKVISGYPDELRYVGIGRSLIKGQGLLLHGMESGFQKILYSICITPAFFIKSTAGQIRVVGYINSLIMASAVFPIYGLCRRILKENRDINYVLVLGITFPAFVYTMYFMSEVIFLPLSLWVVYCVWCIFCAERFSVKLKLNILLGILCYMTYLNKEIALYFVISYVIVYAVYCLLNHDRLFLGGIICLVVFAGVFIACFLLMKGTVFRGLPNSYSETNLQVLNLKLSWEKIRYLLYGFAYDMVFAVLAFGIFPVLIPIAFFDKKEKESWFFLFLFGSFLIGCVTVAYMITLPEDFGYRAPRLHMRYVEPLIIPFYIVMVDKIRKIYSADKRRFQIMGTGIVLFSILLLGGSGGGSFLADNSTLLYYELFARFLCKSEVVLLLLRGVIVTAAIIGFAVLCRQKHWFLKLFGVLFIALNIVNSAAGICAGYYRYSIPEGQREQAVYGNEYLHDLEGNILLLSVGRETSPEDKRIFDTYVDQDFYVCDMDSVEMKAYLGDLTLDLETEQICCDVTGNYYPNLREVDYLIVKEEYGIQLEEEFVVRMDDFPMEGYNMYKNPASGEIHFASVP